MIMGGSRLGFSILQKYDYTQAGMAISMRVSVNYVSTSNFFCASGILLDDWMECVVNMLMGSWMIVGRVRTMA